MAQYRVKTWIAGGAVLLALAASPAALAAPTGAASQGAAVVSITALSLSVGEPPASQIVENLWASIEWLWQSLWPSLREPTVGAAAPAPGSTLPPQDFAMGGDDASGPWPVH